MQLPPIEGQPYTPKRNIKPHAIDVPCTNPEESCGPEPHTHRQWIGKDNDRIRNGSGWLERKASGEIVYHTPWLTKHAPFKLQNPKPRVETPAKTLARLKKECVTPIELKKYIGIGDGDEYVMTQTNGHWALLEPGQQKKETKEFLSITGNHWLTALDDPELYCAVQRAKTMIDERKPFVDLFNDSKELTLHSSSDAGDFTESVQSSLGLTWRLTLDLQYLTMPLGSWPMLIWVEDGNSESPVIFEPVDGLWRFVLMPVHCSDSDSDFDWTKVQMD
jgi:hypothetical protein